MQSVVAEDVTIPWGRAPDPLDQQTHRWRMAVFQDLQCSADGSKLYWLYDPVADETSGTSGGRKGGPSIVVFDMNMRCFLREIPLSVRPNVEGVPKFLFALNTPSPAGGAALVLCTQVQIPNAGGPVQFWRVNLSGDGVSLAGQLIPLLHSPIPVSEDWIVCLREDAPELALLTGPGLSVFRIDVQSQAPGQPLESFSVPDGNMRNYYDGFIHAGSFHMLSSTDDGTFDFSRVHKLDITGRNRMVMSGTRPDPERGYPPARKQAALDCTDGSILLAGGEFEDQSSRVHRLVDYWVLNLNTLEWLQLPGQMPLPLIEPRLTTVFNAGQPPPPPYPGTGGGSYPSQGGGNPPGYPPQGGRGGGGGGGYSPQQGGGYPPQGGGYPPQGGGYPPPGGYSADSKEQEAYSQQQQPGGYPTQQDQGGYPTQQQGDGYPTQQQGGGYPTQQQGGGYPTQQQGGGYPTQQQGQGGYPAQQQGQGGYPTQQQGGGYPAGQTAYYPPDSKPQKSQGCAVA